MSLTIKEKIAKLRAVKEQISDKISELYKQLESESAVELNQKLKGKYFRDYNNLNKMGAVMCLSDYSIYYITEVLFEGNGFYIRLDSSSNNSIEKILKKISNGNETIRDICDINQGIVSGADYVSPKHKENYTIKLVIFSILQKK